MCLRSSTKQQTVTIPTTTSSDGEMRNFGWRPLVHGVKNPVAVFFVMAWCHICVTVLCLNVCFDLLVLGLPAYVLLRPFSSRVFRTYMGHLINYTTPIVFNTPMVVSGSKLYCDSMDFYENKVKKQNSLMLANHGSRIDWMIGMFVGYINKPNRVRVGFVCERVIQYMPLIGWYRRLVCEDVFVDRSFNVDKINIANNLDSFHADDISRQLYLSPEGVVVDFGERDQKYIQACREFCTDFGLEPFDYVLTPRYKGQTVLCEHIKNGGSIASICTAFVRDGKLLNCEMTSEHRVIPDIYSLCSGVGGSPVDMFINLHELHFNKDSDIKTIMMKDYERKNALLKEWHTMLKAGKLEEFQNRFEAFQPAVWQAQFIQALHVVMQLLFFNYFGKLSQYFTGCVCLFLLVSISHTVGWMLNSTSMESVPFETAIKGIMMALMPSTRKHKGTDEKKSK